MKMKIRKVHCLFEQSGTFKNEFKKLGYNAFDYDIEDRFGETDFKIDLFKSINNDLKDIDIKENDLVFAFFPCTYFSGQNDVLMTRLNDKEKVERLKIRSEYFFTLLKLILILKQKKCSFIIENPYHNSFLKTKIKEINLNYFIDYNRTFLGDNFKKETFYFYDKIEFAPITMSFSPVIPLIKNKKVLEEKGINRSLITSEYAQNFITFYLGVKQNG